MGDLVQLHAAPAAFPARPEVEAAINHTQLAAGESDHAVAVCVGNARLGKAQPPLEH